jgi:hypothetical protein
VKMKTKWQCPTTRDEKKSNRKVMTLEGKVEKKKTQIKRGRRREKEKFFLNSWITHERRD